MRTTRPLLAAAFACGLVVSSPLAGQQPAGKDAKADPELARIQGTWVLTKIDAAPPLGPVPPAEYKGVTGTVSGSLLKVTIPGKDGNKGETPQFVLAPDSSKSPRQLDVFEADDKGKPTRITIAIKGKGSEDGGVAPPYRAIYKLEGDTLVICTTHNPNQPRPTAFKATAPKNPNNPMPGDPPYLLLYLTKKK